MPSFLFVKVTNNLTPDKELGGDLPVYPILWYRNQSNNNYDQLQQFGDAPISIGKSVKYDLSAYDGLHVSIGAFITSSVNAGDAYALHAAFNSFDVAIEESGASVGLFSIQGTYRTPYVSYDGEE